MAGELASVYVEIDFITEIIYGLLNGGGGRLALGVGAGGDERAGLL